MAHYFDATDSKSQERLIEIDFENLNLYFWSDNSVFSKNELDDGSRLLIKAFLDNHSGNFSCLDLGCGLGVVGIISNKFNSQLKFDYLDINARAVHLTKKNLSLNKLEGNVFASDCLDAVVETDKKYDIILANPPIRAGNATLFKMFSQAKEVLNKGGKFIVVLRIKQGAKTYIKHIEEDFGNSKILEKDKGFVVCEFTK